MANTSTTKSQPNASSFPIVGIGASAGGLEAYTNLLKDLPSDSGMVFVLVQHLSPDSPSMLSEILARVTEMPVEQATNNLTVQPNHIYVIPPDKQMTIADNQLKLAPRAEAKRPFMPINLFFQSLAEHYANRSVGIVLSGLDSDGAEGLKRIKEAGGITFAQTEDTAQHSSMPNSAIETGYVDFILPPADIAQTLVEIAQHPYLQRPVRPQPKPIQANRKPSLRETDSEPLQQNSLFVIYGLLRATTGVDFTQYKRTTFERRLRRRMVLHRLNSIEDYVEYLRTDLSEVKALYHDVLITVTSFFRDPESFAFLKESAFPTLIEQKELNSSIRIWVTGCATGEECYSLAICLLECLSAHDINLSIQIFGTDVSEEAIEIARQGNYSESQMAGVSPERRSRFFTRTEGRYQISKAIRELCVFARQNLGSDPPFSNIDLVSCRNVMIYFTPVLQKRVLAIFHYALNADGLLWLGGSESVGETSELFSVVNKQHRVYSRNLVMNRLSFDFVTSDYLALNPLRSSETQPVVEMTNYSNVQRQADQIVLSRYGPVGVIFTEHLEIIQFRGDTSLYFRPSPGEPSFNLLKMIKPSLLVEVRSAIEQCKVQKSIARRENLQVEGNPRFINVEVTPIRNPLSQEFSYLLLFEETSPIQPESTDRSDTSGNNEARTDHPEVERLKRELAAARQELLDTQAYLQATVEDQEAVNQRLTTANEEILSSNEELQSTNEELQTAKEEIQAANEELRTTNEELESRNVEARSSNDDLLNLLINVNIPIVMLSNDLCIRRFTPASQNLFNLIPSDVGRPINNIRLNIDVPNLEERIARVIETLNTQEHEVQDQEGRWYRLRIRPYRTTENQIDGAVITLIDIDDIKHTLRDLELSRLYAESIVQTVREPLMVLTKELRIKSANQAFYDLFQLTPTETEERLLFDVDSGQWDMPELRSRLTNFSSDPTLLQDFELTDDFVRIGTKNLLFNAREIEQIMGEQMILLSIDDITARKRAEAERIQLLQEQVARAEAETANASKDEFLSVLSHELRTPLNSIMGWTGILQRQPEIEAELLNRAIMSIERSARSQTRIISDLLEISSVIQGKLSLHLQAIDLNRLLHLVIDLVQPMMASKNIQFSTTLADLPRQLNLDPERMQQVFWNGLTNAIKFTPEGGQISMSLAYTDDQARIEITDTGDGIDPKFLPYVFDRFRQADSSNIRRYGGLGLGLAIVKYFTEAHHGTVTIDSPGISQGCTLTITLPLSMTVPEPIESIEPLSPDDADAADLSSLCVLVVEDDTDSLEILRLTLQMQNARVITATSVGEAMTQFAEVVPDLLISDISLPDQDGFDLIRQIRALPPEQGGNVPAIALTGYAATSDTERLLEAGFQRHVAKPFDIETLLVAIISLFRQDPA